jgi:hypothetical protein
MAYCSWFFSRGKMFTQANLRSLAAGIASFFPIFRKLTCGGTGGTDNSRYCYSVWLRHLQKMYSAGILRSNPQAVAELGPGDSLGVGLCALLSGARYYYAFDAVRHTAADQNMRIFEELVGLFSKRADIPDEKEFPLLKPPLKFYGFPSQILPDHLVGTTLAGLHIEAIKRSISGNEPESYIRYAAPWNTEGQLQPEIVDLIISQAVLEHVEDIGSTYRALFKWLKPGGVMTHTIDFKSHGLTRAWNGHWTISAPLWKIMKGSRPYLLNRLPRSAHISEIERAGFRIAYEEKYEMPPIVRGELAREFTDMSDEDLKTSGTFIICLKP